MVGLAGQDEMHIKSIAGRESWIGTIPWYQASESDHQMWQAVVTPMVWNIKKNVPNPRDETTNMQSCYYLPGCAFAALPFKYWRGIMRYRFQVIASQFHRGRLRVVWDPEYITKGAFDSDKSNIVYSTIIDLADSRDFYIDVAWGKAYLFDEITEDLLPQSGKDLSTVMDFDNNSYTMPSLSQGIGNGCISIYVLNKLVSPDIVAQTGDVSINVYMSCPDMQVAAPVEDRIDYMSPDSPPQGQPRDPVAQGGFEEAANAQSLKPTGAQSGHLLGPPAPAGTMDLYAVNFGDPISSIRCLMKRYCFYTSYPLPKFNKAALAHGETAEEDLSVPTTLDLRLNLSNQPEPLGLNPFGNVVVKWFTNQDTRRAMMLVKTTPIAYFTRAFLTRRGGIRWKYNAPVLDGGPSGSPEGGHWAAGSGYNSTLSVVRHGWTKKPALEYKASNAGNDPLTSNGTAQVAFSMSVIPSGISGMFASPANNNPVVEVELPYFSEKRFG